MSVASGRQVQSNLACCGTSGCNDQMSLSGQLDHNFSMRGCATPSACTLKENEVMSFGGDVYKLTRDATCTNRGSPGALPSLAAIVFQVTAGLLFANVFFPLSLAEGASSSS
ncbi:UNVERIFIED_CONTAM: hypothetical protein K2H54_027644 [Gekko kuhli]